jgi:hypothetical protein
VQLTPGRHPAVENHFVLRDNWGISVSVSSTPDLDAAIPATPSAHGVVEVVRGGLRTGGKIGFKASTKMGLRANGGLGIRASGGTGLRASVASRFAAPAEPINTYADTLDDP